MKINLIPVIMGIMLTAFVWFFAGRACQRIDDRQEREHWLEYRKLEWDDCFQNGAILMSVEMRNYIETNPACTLGDLRTNDYPLRLAAEKEFNQLHYPGWYKP